MKSETLTTNFQTGKKPIGRHFKELIEFMGHQEVFEIDGDFKIEFFADEPPTLYVKHAEFGFASPDYTTDEDSYESLSIEGGLYMTTSTMFDDGETYRINVSTTGPMGLQVFVDFDNTKYQMIDGRRYITGVFGIATQWENKKTTLFLSGTNFMISNFEGEA